MVVVILSVFIVKLLGECVFVKVSEFEEKIVGGIFLFDFVKEKF